ncbi:MAG TPA: subclass B1 metallo-beta-lactamase [Flavobacteriales bacterium]
MKSIIGMVRLFVISTAIAGCSAAGKGPFRPEVVHKTDDLIITQLSERTYKHTSFLQTEDFGNVPCNGLIVVDDGQAIIFDTPTTDSTSEALITWISGTLGSKVKAIVPTHFHNDCLAGLQAFHAQGIPSYAYHRTLDLAREKGYEVPQNVFTEPLILQVGDEDVIVTFFGEGHTVDNVVGYFPGEHVLFGGCLIKEIDAGKGFLGDANVAAWSATVEKVKQAYPDVQVVVPGHGEHGDKALLDYTIGLFRTP